MGTTDLIIAFVKQNPGSRAWFIAKGIDKSGATVSSILKKLVDRGVLKRQKMPDLEAWTYWSMTLRAQIVEFVLECPGHRASFIIEQLKADSGNTTRELKRLCDRGVLEKRAFKDVDGFGYWPKGHGADSWRLDL